MALERSLNLSKVALEGSVEDALRDAVPLQIELARALSFQENAAPLLQQRLRQPEGYRQLATWDMHKQRWLAKVGGGQQFDWPLLSRSDVQKLHQQGAIGGLESIHDTLYIRGWVSIPNVDNADIILFFRKPVPKAIAQDAILIDER